MAVSRGRSGSPRDSHCSPVQPCRLSSMVAGMTPAGRSYRQRIHSLDSLPRCCIPVAVTPGQSVNIHIHTDRHTYRQVGAEVCGRCSVQDVCTHMVLGGVCTGLWPVPTSQRWTRPCSPRRSEVTAGVRRGVLRDCLSSRTVSASGHTAHHYNW